MAAGVCKERGLPGFQKGLQGEILTSLTVGFSRALALSSGVLMVRLWPTLPGLLSTPVGSLGPTVILAKLDSKVLLWQGSLI